MYPVNAHRVHSQDVSCDLLYNIRKVFFGSVIGHVGGYPAPFVIDEVCGKQDNKCASKQDKRFKN